jgi:Flp pilus assembly protein TadD
LALEKGRLLFPEDLRLKRHRAVFLAHKGEVEEALSLVKELRVAEPNDNQNISNEASLLLVLGSLDELQQLLDTHPQDSGEYFANVAHLALRRGRVEDARKAARRSCELSPLDPK